MSLRPWVRLQRFPLQPSDVAASAHAFDAALKQQLFGELVRRRNAVILMDHARDMQSNFMAAYTDSLLLRGVDGVGVERSDLIPGASALLWTASAAGTRCHALGPPRDESEQAPPRPDAPPQKPGLCGPGEPGARARPGRDPRDCS